MERPCFHSIRANFPTNNYFLPVQLFTFWPLSALRTTALHETGGQLGDRQQLQHTHI
jgi:hypothetical protein